MAEAHRLLIQAYYDTRRYEQARQSLRRAQDLGFDFPDLRAALQKVKAAKPTLTVQLERKGAYGPMGYCEDRIDLWNLLTSLMLLPL